MREVITVKAQAILSVIKEILHQGNSAKIAVTGMSMYPFLREGSDYVELYQANFEGISRGDIVIIQRDTGQYVMHRVLKKASEDFCIVGDAQQWIEGPLHPEQLVALITAVWRKGKRIDCSNFWWRLLSGLWLGLLPFRHIMLWVFSKLRRLYGFFQ